MKNRKRETYTCFVVSQEGKPLMPTNSPRKVRRLLKNKRARIFKYRPFTIQLLYPTENGTQETELCMDTGYLHIGLSIKTEKKELYSAQYDLLSDEKERHMAKAQYRRSRRNRLRHRKPRFENRKKEEGWLAPSLKNKADRHIDLVKMFSSICPISKAVLEVGQFDTNALHAIEAGEKLPEGKDYQQGLMYQHDTLREAVFQRDAHTCQVCGKSAFKDKAILCLHHIGFRYHDRSNRSSNLLTVCTKCHTAANHKPNGKLWNLKPARTVKSAAFMNTVRWYIYKEVKKVLSDVRITYGASTKRTRLERNIPKSHANDAYCIGEFFPKKRCSTLFFKKKRRNSRVLEKFYDAKYIDSRDGSIKSGSQLSAERTNRKTPRNNPNSLRKYRLQRAETKGGKISKGRRQIRRKRYPLQHGDVACYEGRKYILSGTQNLGTRVVWYDNTTSRQVSAAITKIKYLYHQGGWERYA